LKAQFARAVKKIIKNEKPFILVRSMIVNWNNIVNFVETKLVQIAFIRIESFLDRQLRWIKKGEKEKYVELVIGSLYFIKHMRSIQLK